MTHPPGGDFEFFVDRSLGRSIADGLRRPDSWSARWLTGTLIASFGGIRGTGRRFRIDQAVITHLPDRKVIEAWEIADIVALREQVAN